MTSSFVHITDSADAVRRLQAHRNARQELGLHAGVLCVGCNGSAVTPCGVCRRQRQLIIDMNTGGRTPRGIAASVGLPAGRIREVLAQAADQADLARGRRQQQRSAHTTTIAAAGGPLHFRARNKLRSNAVIPAADVHDAIAKPMAEQDVCLSELGARVGYRDFSHFARALGLADSSPSVRNGRAYAPQRQHTVTVELAAAVCRALGVDPREVPGL